MAKLNVPKAFDKALLPSSIKKDIDPLVDYLNQQFDQILRAFLNQITISDNLQGQITTINATHNTPISISTGGQQPSGILILKSEVGIKSFVSTSLTSGQLQITFQFDGDRPVQTRNATKSAPFITYEIQQSSSVKPGDMLSITNFGNKLNNGSFLCLYRDDKTVSVYNSAGAAETKASFSGDSDASKEIVLFILF